MKKEKEIDINFGSELAYRIAAVLRTYAENGHKEMLIPEIAYKARVSYASTLYWINIFDVCAFISTYRYVIRQNEGCRPSRHIQVILFDPQRVTQLCADQWRLIWELRMKKLFNVELTPEEEQVLREARMRR